MPEIKKETAMSATPVPMELARKPNFYKITIAEAENGYGQQLPPKTRRLRFRCRTAAAVLYAFNKDAVNGVGPPGPYSTLKSGTEFDVDSLDFGGQKLWVSGAQGLVVEVEAYTQS